MCGLTASEQRSNFRVSYGKKVNLPLSVTKYHSMKTYGGVRNSPTYLASTQGGDEWSASQPGRITPKERAPGTLGQEARKVKGRSGHGEKVKNPFVAPAGILSWSSST
jgi:hypothetical protein